MLSLSQRAERAPAAGWQSLLDWLQVGSLSPPDRPKNRAGSRKRDSVDTSEIDGTLSGTTPATPLAEAHQAGYF